MSQGRKRKQKEIAEGQTDLIDDGVLGDGFTDPASSAGAVDAERSLAETAEQVRDRRPETYRECQAMLAGGVSIRAIKRILGLSPLTIKAIRAKEENLGALRQRLGGLKLLVSEVAAEAALEDLTDDERVKKIPTVHKAMIASYMAKSGNELLTGGVQTTVNVSVTMTPEQYERERAALMGSAEGNSPSKGLGMTPDGVDFARSDVGTTAESDKAAFAPANAFSAHSAPASPRGTPAH